VCRDNEFDILRGVLSPVDFEERQLKLEKAGV